MGRALLFLVAGSFVIFGMIQLGVSGRQSSMNKINVQYVQNAQARNIANSALESALNRLSTDEAWRAGPQQPFRYQYGGEYADVQVVDGSMQGITLPANVVEVRSTGVSGDRQATAVARIEVEDGLPDINSPVGVYTENSNLQLAISGTSFSINGNDPVSGVSLPGISVNNQTTFDELNSLDQKYLNRITGSTSIAMDTNMDSGKLAAFVQQAIANADQTLSSGRATWLGTSANPQITIIDGNVRANPQNGTGILIIKEGATFTAPGKFDFNGLIIVQGSVDFRGNVTLNGAFILGGDQPDMNVSMTLKGNVDVLYDHSIVSQLTTMMPEVASKKQRIVGIYD